MNEWIWLNETFKTTKLWFNYQYTCLQVTTLEKDFLLECNHAIEKLLWWFLVWLPGAHQFLEHLSGCFLYEVRPKETFEFRHCDWIFVYQHIFKGPWFDDPQHPSDHFCVCEALFSLPHRFACWYCCKLNRSSDLQPDHHVLWNPCAANRRGPSVLLVSPLPSVVYSVTLTSCRHSFSPSSSYTCLSSTSDCVVVVLVWVVAWGCVGITVLLGSKWGCDVVCWIVVDGLWLGVACVLPSLTALIGTLTVAPAWITLHIKSFKTNNWPSSSSCSKVSDCLYETTYSMQPSSSFGFSSSTLWLPLAMSFAT